MNFLRGLWKKILNPGLGGALCGLAVFLFSFVLSLLAVIGKIEFGAFSYVCFAVAFLSLVYCIYLAVIFFPRVRKRIVEGAEKYRVPGRFVHDYGFRTQVYSGVKMTINIAYALFEGVLAAIALSVWYGALSAYHLLLSIMRFFILDFVRRESKSEAPPLERERGRAKMYAKCGVMIILLTLALSGAIVQMVVMKNEFRYAGLMIYAVAAYTTYKVALSVVNAVKAHRYRDESVQALRNINLADAAVSLLALQTAMFAAFGSGQREEFVMNAVTGAAVCLFIVGMGLYMLIRGNLKSRRLPQEESACD